jgi:hypothetical protein
MEVNHEKKGFVINKTPIICDRGQSVYSLKNWGKLFGKRWTIQRVRTFFKHLSEDNMIIIEEVKRISTKLTVCNYDTYQSQQHSDNTVITNRQQTDNKLTTTTKELKKERIKEYIPEWLCSETWKDFQDMRKKIKKPMTERAEKGIIKKLEQFGIDSHIEILEQSIENSWSGVFELKDNSFNKKQSFAEREMQEQADYLFAGTELAGLGIDIIKGQSTI